MASIQTWALVWGAAPTLQGHRARNRVFVCSGGQRRAPAPVGDVGSAPPPLMPPLRNSSPFSQHSFLGIPLCPAALPVPTAPPWLPAAHRWAPREGLGPPGQRSSYSQRSSWHFVKWEKELPLDTPIPPQKHRGRRNRNTGGAAGAVQTLRDFPGGERQEGVGGSGLVLSSSSSGPRLGQDQSSFSPDPILSVFYLGLLSPPFPAPSAPDLCLHLS